MAPYTVKDLKARTLTKLEDSWSILEEPRRFDLNRTTAFSNKKRWRREETLQKERAVEETKFSPGRSSANSNFCKYSI